jgi:NADPH-dependent 2,4-dienoyl-CoA reductase/sulfur reductase-like enzyme
MDRREFDVVVVGGGPAGLAAARRTTESGAGVAIVDDNPKPGGQIWRSPTRIPGEWGKAAGRCMVNARVVAAPERGRLTLETPESGFDLQYRTLILATGARERFLPFPGWTLPHVVGAGGLQALAKSGWPIEGKRIVIAGSGPLLLAVAKYMRDHGANVRLIAEQAEQSALLRFGVGLAANPGKLIQAVQLRAGLLGIPYLTSCWPVGAEPGAVTLRRGAKTWVEPCDYLACGFGLIPNTELAALLGCRISDGGVAVSEFQETSLAGTYAAGEVTGIGGVDLSLVEGEIAGYAAAGKPEAARKHFAARESQRGFAASLERAFALREELKALANDDTLVCRCEDVPLGRLCPYTDWREAKLQTRCGMGPCQGRVCGGAVEFLLGWKSDSIRPPVFPARIGSL